MWVWYLGDPMVPRLVGSVSLLRGSRCTFHYARDWVAGGFALCPDMPLDVAKVYLPRQDMPAPGAIADAMPDRWGEAMIRLIENPRRASPLDMLYYAADCRFGALGISLSEKDYRPCPTQPLVTVASLEEANEVIQRAIMREHLSERERVLVANTKSMGGTHPKMLIGVDGEQWLAKFPKDDPVDLPLIEYATNLLAREVGITVPDVDVRNIGIAHVVMMKRFDRLPGGGRVHALTARTMLLASGDESYTGMADVIRARAPAELRDLQRRELFSRMAFNILVENTDDHSKNHAFLRDETTGRYSMSPAFDLVPQMQGDRFQAMRVTPGADEDDFMAAIASCGSFGLKHEEAIAAWRHVAHGVSRWKEFFSGLGVSGSDIEYLGTTIDSDGRLAMRDDRIADTLPRPGAVEHGLGRRIAAARKRAATDRGPQDPDTDPDAPWSSGSSRG
jgi:serine/threonine-protein kinase HipA